MLSRLKKDEWIIAIRKRGEEQFRIIPNTLRYWCADPFVKEIDGHTFLLFEMYDRLKGKGLIGYRKFDGIKWGKPKVLIEDATHLSYPFVYEENGKMYIMPESNRAGHLYRVELSLMDGELTVSNKTILKKGRYADTTRLETSEEHISTIWRKAFISVITETFCWSVKASTGRERIRTLSKNSRISSQSIFQKRM